MLSNLYTKREKDKLGYSCHKFILDVPIMLNVSRNILIKKQCRWVRPLCV